MTTTEITQINQAFQQINERVKKQIITPGGINSRVYKIETYSGKSYIIKFYPKTDSNQRNIRFKRETYFLKYTKDIAKEQTPTLIRAGKNKDWCIQEFIPGEVNFEITLNDLHIITDFIDKINLPSEKRRDYPWDASEAYKSKSSFVEHTIKKMEEVQTLLCVNQCHKEGLLWLTNHAKPFIHKEIRQFLENEDITSVNNKYIGNYISPSDVGIHNTIKTKTGLRFIDFEYAGKDDISKFVADWVLQPNFFFSEKLEYNFIKILSRSSFLTQDKDWIIRYSRIKPLIICRWTLIMLKAMARETSKPSSLSKIASYFDKL